IAPDDVPVVAVVLVAGLFVVLFGLLFVELVTVLVPPPQAVRSKAQVDNNAVVRAIALFIVE
ncbi:MAG: hypothetical protein ACYTXY_20710, partial [Nostoc sp.]